MIYKSHLLWLLPCDRNVICSSRNIDVIHEECILHVSHFIGQQVVYSGLNTDDHVLAQAEL